MSIEIKHLTITSTIVDERRRSQINAPPQIDVEDLKEKLLAECKRLIIEHRRINKER